VDMVLSPDGAMLAMASRDGNVRFFEVDVDNMTSAEYDFHYTLLALSIFICMLLLWNL